MRTGTLWLLLVALSLINFGVDLIVAGTQQLSGWDLAIMTGSWMTLAGIGLLAWMVTARRNGNGTRE